MSNKKTQLTKQQLLTQEIIMALKNIKPSYRNWKNIMLKVNMFEMKHGVEVIKNTFDHALDIKQYCENFILICLNECKNQFQDNSNQHLKIIELFEKIHQLKLETSYINYDFILSLLIQEYDSGLNKLSIAQNDNETLLRTITFKEEKESKIILHDTANGINLKLKNFQHNDRKLSRVEMVHLEEKVSSTWNLLTTMLSKYLKDFRHQHLSYGNQMERNTKNREIIVEHFNQTTQLLGFIAEFQSKFMELNNSADERVSKLFSIKYLLDNSYDLMVKHYNTNRKVDDFQLILLVKQYNLTIKILQNLTKKSRHILFLIRACRKFQMHLEKSLPVQDDQFDNLEFFWYKMNTANLQLDDLKKEKQGMLEEWNDLYKSVKFQFVN